MTPLGEGPRWHPKLRDLDLPPLGSGVRAHVLATRTLLFVVSGHSVAFRGQEQEVRNARAGNPSPPSRAAGDTTALGPDDWQLAEPTLWAFDKANGNIVVQIPLSAHADAGPISYLHDGRQYLVFAIGGRDEPFEIVAFALP